MTKISTNSQKPVDYQSDKTSSPHSKIEDFIALLTGTSLIAFAVLLLQPAHIMLGGTAGLALLAHHITQVRFSILFWLFNLPFYYLAYKKMGLPMVIKTALAVTLLAIMTEIHPLFIHIDKISPIYATIFANLLLGVGFLILFRHRASLGGFNLLALYIQEHYKISAGKVQMCMDICVLLLSLVYVSLPLVLISIVGGVVLNLVIAMNHRSDRYIGS